MITFKPLTMDNFWDVIRLKIHKHQDEYIPDNTFLIALSKIHPGSIPIAIYHEDVVVGFLLYGIDVHYWIHILMIDKKYQGKKYARQAFELILQEIKKDKKHHKILLAVNKGNHGAVKLYEKFGFKFNGKKFEEYDWAIKIYQHLLHDEYMMELDY